MNGHSGIEVWRGGVNTWECNSMGHMNVRFYVARAMEGLVGLAAALGLEGAFRSGADSTLRVEDMHVKFIREAGPRASLHMTGGVIEIGEDHARLQQILVHTPTGLIAASFQMHVAHVTAHEGRVFAWSHETLGRAGVLRVETPSAAAPRSLEFGPAPASEASLENADRLSLPAISAGAFGPEDCDVFGRMKPEVFMARISDGVPNLVRALAPPDEGEQKPGIGGAALEYRLVYRAWPRAGDRFVIRSGLAGVDAKAQRYVHWMLNPATGQPWGTAEAIGVGLDLVARKIIAINPNEHARLSARISPGLAL